MKTLAILSLLVFSLSATVFAQTLPQTVVCVEKKGLSTTLLTLDLMATEGRVPMYKITLMTDGEVYYNLESYLEKSDASAFSVRADLEDEEMSDMLVYAGYSKKSGEAYFQMAANNGMSPLPGKFFSNCKSF